MSVLELGRFAMLWAFGLFAGTVLAVAIIYAATWRDLPAQPFVADFRRVIKRVDLIQPILLLISLAGTASYALSASGAGRALAFLASGGQVLTLVLSVAVLVPLQNRIIASRASDDELGTMRRAWLRGHLGRTALVVAAFSCVVVASVVG